MIVAKFGGAVLDGPDGVRRVCDEIGRLSKPLLVVVSAFANVTNLLEGVAESAIDDPAVARSLLDAIASYHSEIARDVLSSEGFKRWCGDTSTYITRLGEVVEGLGIVRELSPRTLDLIVHFGERYSSSIILAALSERADHPVHCVSALDVIITDNSYRYAHPDLELTRERALERLKPHLDRGEIVVTEGYIARGTSGQATTMGRESSDFSATLLASILSADEVRIYTRVPGILTADPAYLPEAQTLPRMSYSMAHTLAELGAKILHPRTVTPLEQKRIPLVITGLGGEGTRIGSHGEDGCSVSFLPEAELISVETSTAGVGIDAFMRAISAEAPIIWQHRFRRRLQLLVAGHYPHSALPTQTIPEWIHAESQRVSVVSLVRERRFDGGDLQRVFGALGEHTPAAMQGAIDSHAISIALPGDIALDLVRALHSEFVEQERGGVP